jgi:hypothetical protein
MSNLQYPEGGKRQKKKNFFIIFASLPLLSYWAAVTAFAFLICISLNR